MTTDAYGNIHGEGDGKFAGHIRGQVTDLGLDDELPLDELFEVPGASPERLAELAKHSHWQVRAEVADWPDTPDHVRDELRRDDDWGVRFAAAGHGPATGALVSATDPNPCVRAATLTSNRDLPAGVADRLAQDSAVVALLTRSPHLSGQEDFSS